MRGVWGVRAREPESVRVCGGKCAIVSHLASSAATPSSRPRAYEKKLKILVDGFVKILQIRPMIQAAKSRRTVTCTGLSACGRPASNPPMRNGELPSKSKAHYA